MTPPPIERRQGEDEGEDEQEDERDDEGGPADKQKPEMKTKFLPSLACTLLIANRRAVLFFIPLRKKIFHVLSTNP